MLEVCGVNCAECEKYKKECLGCSVIKGKVYWAQFIGKTVCPVYQCAEDQNFKNCGECSKVPCKMWFSMKDPNLTDEQHLKSIKDRANKLRSTK
jgi:hypothetical protein